MREVFRSDHVYPLSALDRTHSVAANAAPPIAFNLVSISSWYEADPCVDRVCASIPTLTPPEATSGTDPLTSTEPLDFFDWVTIFSSSRLAT